MEQPITRSIHWVQFISCIVLCQAAGLFGLIFTRVSVDTWYAGLIKPSFNPPSWLFGPVWTILYILMAISLYLILQKPSSTERSKGLTFFYIQLFLNAIWSFLFFGLRNPLSGLIEIVVLLFMIAVTIISFHKVNPIAAALLYPYVAWVSFATLLNYFIYTLN